MKEPKKVYQALVKKHGLKSAKTVVYNEMKNKYFEFQPDIYDKLIFAFKDYQPGKIYTFNYKNPIYKNILEFYDRRPIVLVLGKEYNRNTKHHLVLGINLNFLPDKVKANLLDIIYKEFKTLIDKDIALKRKKKERSKNIFRTDVKIYPLMKKLLNEIGKIGFEFCIRKYEYRRMQLVRSVDFEDWGKVALIDSKDTVKKSIEEIYQIYWSWKKANQTKMSRPTKRQK